jgi:hypothetical protein
VIEGIPPQRLLGGCVAAMALVGDDQVKRVNWNG